MASAAVTRERDHVGSRLLAFAGVWLLLCGLAAALSFVVVAVVATGVLLALGLAAAAVLLLLRLEPARRLHTVVALAAAGTRAAAVLLLRLEPARRLRRLLAFAAAGTRAATQRVQGVRVRGRVPRPRLDIQEASARAHERASVLHERANVLATRGLRAYTFAFYRLQLRTYRALLAATRLANSVPRIELRRVAGSGQAVRLNELGAELRRRGDHKGAAEQHRVALAIARDLGDEEAEAMTLNNLALALAQGGAEEEAVEHLELARFVLKELGDEEHEAQVIANLGMVHRRQGHSEEAVSLLHEALDKLPPESSAYRRVEEELRRAS
jgi:tetratricopeptide (TPR) repeat protein